MKRIPELRALSDDHHRGLVLARKAKKAGVEGGASVRDVWDVAEFLFSTVLEPHFRIEETYIGSNLDAMGQTGMVERLYEEHKALREFLLPGSGRSSTDLQNFGVLLEKHIRFEERELFAVAQNKLSTDVLCEIEKASNIENR